MYLSTRRYENSNCWRSRKHSRRRFFQVVKGHKCLLYLPFLFLCLHIQRALLRRFIPHTNKRLPNRLLCAFLSKLVTIIQQRGSTKNADKGTAKKPQVLAVRAKRTEHETTVSLSNFPCQRAHQNLGAQRQGFERN